MKATPQHYRAGRPPKLLNSEVEQIITYLKTSRKTRRMTSQQITDYFWPERDISADTVSAALKRAGMNRYVTLRKPVLTEVYRLARLQ